MMSLPCNPACYLLQNCHSILNRGLWLPWDGVQAEGEPDYDAGLAKVASKKDFDALIASEGPTVVKFWAPWCVQLT